MPEFGRVEPVARSVHTILGFDPGLAAVGRFETLSCPSRVSANEPLAQSCLSTVGSRTPEIRKNHAFLLNHFAMKRACSARTS